MSITTQLEKMASEELFDDRERFIIFDGHALLYRAFHGFPELSSPDGTLVNAVYGFTRILLTVIRDFEPKYLAVAFDHKAKTKRAEKYASYKANRPEMPEGLRHQIPMVKDIVTALNIPLFTIEGEEADDLIGSIAAQVQASGTSKTVLTTIVSGDKDLLQLVTPDVSVWIPGGKWSKDTEYFAPQVVTKMGVAPNQVVDLKALMGDASDNIPGVAGIGKVGAQKLIAACGTLENLYELVEKVTAGEEEHPLLKGSLLKKLVANKEMAFISQELARIDTAVPIDFDLQKCVVRDYDKEEVLAAFESLNFSSLVRLLPADRFEEALQQALF